MNLNTPDPPTLLTLLERLTAALEALAAATEASDLKLHTPAEAAKLLGKTENWVVEAIQENRIPRTYVGKSPRLTPDHIRAIAAEGEVTPSRFTRKAATKPRMKRVPAAA
ncbi:helix-turn-helix domain-containing protein [Streptomyces sp. MP131-18]|uniref:helix-turn-helix domain-containing protein n=1 Tax=Streptomyces sp. MP131-18 TaxID=1857892 RepID=UPI0009C6A211|nr:helix-turn-helix domain-containing protein [Streptomyces sp. MP131-18]ONK09505.1 hypothetical protein STBA_02050 [Streptomyces sp. MP131-18]